MAKKQTFVSFFFLLSSLFIIIVALTTDKIFFEKEEIENQKSTKKDFESYFSDIDYDLVDSKKNLFSLSALELIDHGDILFFSPKGVIQKWNSSFPINFSAFKGSYSDQDGNITLLHNVYLHKKELELTAMSLFYEQSKNIYTAREDVKTWGTNKKSHDFIEITSSKFIAENNFSYLQYIGQVKGKIIRKRKYQQGLNFSSDFAYFDEKTNEIHLKGNVVLQTSKFDVKALNGVIFLDNYTSKLKYFILNDDVRLTERLTLNKSEGEKVIYRQGMGEKLEGNLADGTFVLTGYPKVIQEGDIIKGNRIMLRDRTDVIEVDDSATNFTIQRAKEN